VIQLIVQRGVNYFLIVVPSLNLFSESDSRRNAEKIGDPRETREFFGFSHPRRQKKTVGNIVLFSIASATVKQNGQNNSFFT